LDTQWSDIDYLSNYRDFTYDSTNYAGLADFVDKLHTMNMHWVPIMDAGIAMRPNVGYDAYDAGVSSGIFIKANSEIPDVDF